MSSCMLLHSMMLGWSQVRKDEIDLLYNLLDINRDGLLELKEVVRSQQRLVKPLNHTVNSAARAA